MCGSIPPRARYPDVAQDGRPVGDRLALLPRAEGVAERVHVGIRADAGVAEQVPGAAARSRPSRMTKLLRGLRVRRWCAAPMPDRPGADDQHVDMVRRSGCRAGLRSAMSTIPFSNLVAVTGRGCKRVVTAGRGVARCIEERAASGGIVLRRRRVPRSHPEAARGQAAGRPYSRRGGLARGRHPARPAARPLRLCAAHVRKLRARVPHPHVRARLGDPARARSQRARSCSTAIGPSRRSRAGNRCSNGSSRAA
jgi:hypothetical protein